MLIEPKIRIYQLKIPVRTYKTYTYDVRNLGTTSYER